jgi:hypothetical protein
MNVNKKIFAPNKLGVSTRSVHIDVHARKVTLETGKFVKASGSLRILSKLPITIQFIIQKLKKPTYDSSDLKGHGLTLPQC